MPLQRLRDTHLPRALAPLLPAVAWRGPRHDAAGRPCLYLTVDDGPDPDGTPHWLDALDRLGASAVFFLTAERAERHPPLVTRIVEQGHRVGSHGYRHRSGWRSGPGTVLRDAAHAATVLSALTSQVVTDHRPPYGRLTPALARWARRSGRRIVLWDLMPGDYLPSRSPRRLADEVVRWARPGSIVVLHDGPPASRAIEALSLALPRLGAAGWRFPPLPPAG